MFAFYNGRHVYGKELAKCPQNPGGLSRGLIVLISHVCPVVELILLRLKVYASFRLHIVYLRILPECRQKPEKVLDQCLHGGQGM